ncbi:MAG: ABC transporter permease [Actinobacteria bacterium]|nr:ABC transporter permease [Actinomycetota bacterium]
MPIVFKMTWIEIKLLAREPVTLVFSFALPVLVLVVLGGIFGDQTMERGAYQGVKMMDWYVPSFIALVIASIGMISLPVHLSSYRERGVLRRFRASGVTEAALLGSQLLVSLSIALVGAAAITILGIFAYGAQAAVAPAEVALSYVVSTFAFVAIGVLLASLAPTARAAQSVGLLLWFVMLFVSGTSAPLDLLPPWMVTVGKALPLYHSVLAVVDPWIGRGMNWTQLLIVAGIGAVATVLSLRLFRWE